MRRCFLMRSTVALRIVFGLVLSAASYPAGAQTDKCAHLTMLSIPDVTIQSAVETHATTLTILGPGTDRSHLPDFCRVTAVATPTSDSAIKFEVWIPSGSRWDDRFQGVGNGGYSGNISYRAMAHALALGDATASTDTGHEGDDLEFAAGHPEKIIDWGYRSIHVMTEAAKLIIRDYAGHFPIHSYFTGCSTGGGQALSQAERFPDDYDGILAGAPGDYRVRLNAGFLWAFSVDHAALDATLTAEKLSLLHKAAITACDALDGVRDGIIDDPLQCHFNPRELLCKGTDGPECLTKSQVHTAQEIYRGPHVGTTQIFPGYEPGSEELKGLFIGGWGAYLTGRSDPMRLDFWKYWVFDDPNWDWHTFDFRRDVSYADQRLAAVNATESNLNPFYARGGKLIIYHGWSDPVVPPRASIDYFENVSGNLGSSKTEGTVRLFLIPAMGHCVGGYGPLPATNQMPGQGTSTAGEGGSEHDFLAALEDWVEKGVPPQRILATQVLANNRPRTRPICAYPRVAKWIGTGSTDMAINFRCVPQTSEADLHKQTGSATRNPTRPRLPNAP